MVRRRIFLVLVQVVMILLYLPSFGQSNINLKASYSVNTMMEKFVENGKANENIKAWRIQIITTDDRRQMESAMSTFTSLYPGVNMDWKHVAPYYQVRVGYYENKNRLMPFLLDLKKTFPSATPVYDQVSKRALVSN
ncbi:MAG TPA: hypothetical protein PKD51_04405 [Saprospiraceae bacterium]|nr:hypothetical protein [Saprospiraceae bacterium]HMU02295.1 hypothetical protein [Saprospiraceae bacterium]